MHTIHYGWHVSPFVAERYRKNVNYVSDNNILDSGPLLSLALLLTLQSDSYLGADLVDFYPVRIDPPWMASPFFWGNDLFAVDRWKMQ